MLRSGVLVLLISLLAPTAGSGQDPLLFTGSFWDTDDSFRLRIEFHETAATPDWDGYPDPSYAFRKNTWNPKRPGLFDSPE